MIERAFLVLSAFDEQHVTLSLSDISRRTHLPLNTALRLIRNLTDVGALERRDDGHYVIGLRLFELATLGPRSQGIRRIAMTAMRDLHAVTDQHVLLTVREGDEAVLVERLTARGARRVAYRVGGRLPLDGTGGGLVLLAHAAPELQETFLSRNEHPGSRASSRFFSDPTEFRRRLAAIRQEGMLTVTGPSADGMSTLAAPIFGEDRAVVAAVSIVAPSADPILAGLGPAVRLTARVISSALRQSNHNMAGA